MSPAPSDPTPALSSDGTAAKRPWHAPEVQEVDVLETEFGAGTYSPADVATYTS